MEWTKTRFTARMMNMWPQIKKLKSIKHAAMVVHPYHVASISKASQNFHRGNFRVGFSRGTETGRDIIYTNIQEKRLTSCFQCNIIVCFLSF